MSDGVALCDAASRHTLNRPFVGLATSPAIKMISAIISSSITLKALSFCVEVPDSESHMAVVRFL